MIYPLLGVRRHELIGPARRLVGCVGCRLPNQVPGSSPKGNLCRSATHDSVILASFRTKFRVSSVKHPVSSMKRCVSPVKHRSLFLFYLYSYYYKRETTLAAPWPSCLILISLNLTSSCTALIFVARSNPVVMVDSTISPPPCSCLNASNRIACASLYVLTLFD